MALEMVPRQKVVLNLTGVSDDRTSINAVRSHIKHAQEIAQQMKKDMENRSGAYYQIWQYAQEHQDMETQILLRDPRLLMLMADAYYSLPDDVKNAIKDKEQREKVFSEVIQQYKQDHEDDLSYTLSLLSFMPKQFFAAEFETGYDEKILYILSEEEFESVWRSTIDITNSIPSNIKLIIPGKNDLTLVTRDGVYTVSKELLLVDEIKTGDHYFTGISPLLMKKSDGTFVLNERVFDKTFDRVIKPVLENNGFTPSEVMTIKKAFKENIEQTASKMTKYANVLKQIKKDEDIPMGGSVDSLLNIESLVSQLPDNNPNKQALLNVINQYKEATKEKDVTTDALYHWLKKVNDEIGLSQDQKVAFEYTKRVYGYWIELNNLRKEIEYNLTSDLGNYTRYTLPPEVKEKIKNLPPQVMKVFKYAAPVAVAGAFISPVVAGIGVASTGLLIEGAVGAAVLGAFPVGGAYVGMNALEEKVEKREGKVGRTIAKAIETPVQKYYYYYRQLHKSVRVGYSGLRLFELPLDVQSVAFNN